MNKRGELTAATTVGIVAGIITLLIVLSLLSVLLSDDSLDDRELCRLTVLERATAPDVVQASVPLNCQTDKICITHGGDAEECHQFLGEEGVGVVRIGGDHDNEFERKQMAREIERVLAEQLYFCWSVMGQGKLDLFGNAPEQLVGSSGDSSCVICSRIAFANNINETILAEIDLDNYLRSETIPLPNSGMNYIEAFTDEGTNTYPVISGIGGSLARADVSARESDSFDEDLASLELEGTSDRQLAVTFAQVKTVAWEDVLFNLASTAVGTTFVVPGGAKIGGALFLSKAGLVTIPLAAAGAGAVGYNAYQGELAAAGYCGAYVSGAGEAERGCSLVQVLNYNVHDINALCTGSIQSKP